MRTKRGAESDRTLGEDGHRVADLDLATLSARDARRCDVGDHQDLFVRQLIGNSGEVRACVRNQQVLRPCTVDGIAEAPPAKRPAALRASVIQAIEALTARRDSADDDAVPDGEFILEAFAERLDDANRFVAEDQTRPDRVFAFHDVHVRAADRRDGDADDRFARTRLRLGRFFDPQFIHAAEHDGFHFVHWLSPWPCAVARIVEFSKVATDSNATGVPV